MKVPHTYPKSNSKIKILLDLHHLFLNIVFQSDGEVFIYPHQFFFKNIMLILTYPDFMTKEKNCTSETLGF